MGKWWFPREVLWPDLDSVNGRLSLFFAAVYVPKSTCPVTSTTSVQHKYKRSSDANCQVCGFPPQSTTNNKQPQYDQRVRSFQDDTKKKTTQPQQQTTTAAKNGWCLQSHPPHPHHPPLYVTQPYLFCPNPVLSPKGKRIANKQTHSPSSRSRDSRRLRC